MHAQHAGGGSNPPKPASRAPNYPSDARLADLSPDLPVALPHIEDSVPSRQRVPRAVGDRPDRGGSNLDADPGLSVQSVPSGRGPEARYRSLLKFATQLARRECKVVTLLAPQWALPSSVEDPGRSRWPRRSGR